MRFSGSRLGFSKTAFFWCGFSLLCIVWIYFRLPEPSGLTFGEIDKVRGLFYVNYQVRSRRLQLFEQKVSARNFKKTGIDMFGRDRQRLNRAKAAVGMTKDGDKEEKKSQFVETL